MAGWKPHRIAFVTAAKLAYGHWFFGRLYEGVAGIPDRLSERYEPGRRGKGMATLVRAVPSLWRMPVNGVGTSRSC